MALTRIFGIRFCITFLSILWAQGGILGYAIHAFLLEPSSTDFTTSTLNLLKNEPHTLIYIGGGTTFFFGLFGFVTANFLDAIRLRNMQLEQLNKIKDDYVATCSHDLRSPLTGIIGYTQLLKMDDRIKEDQMHSLDFIESCGMHLLKIIDEILELTKTHTAAQFKAFSLIDLIHSTVKIYANMAAKKGISLSFNHDPNSELLTGNAALISRGLENLISNAIKFTPRGGAIRISLFNDEKGELKLAVSDTGIGIPGQKIKTILQSSKNIRRLGTEGEKSTGFGLEIVKDVVAMHHANLSVTSSEGQGTTFTITFPPENRSYPIAA